jgi:hypothetical protein
MIFCDIAGDDAPENIMWEDEKQRDYKHERIIQ